MRGQKSKLKWLLATAVIALALALLPHAVWMNNPETNSDELRSDLIIDNDSSHLAPEHGFSRDATVADAKMLHIAEKEEMQTANEPLPRWQQQGHGAVPDILESGGGDDAGVPAAAQGQGKIGSESSPQATAAEAQMTLQTYLTKLTWQEKMMVLRTLTKFSPGEMVEVFQLYKKGSRQAYRDLDAIVMAKMSEADFEKLRALVNKYR